MNIPSLNKQKKRKTNSVFSKTIPIYSRFKKPLTSIRSIDPDLVLFILIALFLPTQLGRHFFFDFSYLSGVKTDYLAPAVYLTDFLIILLAFFYYKALFSFFIGPKIILLLFLFFLNILFSFNHWLAFYQFLKIIELLALFIVVAKTIKKYPGRSSFFLLISFFISSLVQLTLVILQLIKKGSIQGVFYYLGERYLTINQPGVAKTSLSGIEILRPYGSFSHPNSLAGFYLLTYFFTLTFPRFKSHRLIKPLLLFSSTILIFISFSKTAIITLLLGNLFYRLKNRQKNLCRLCLISRLSILFITSLLFLSAKGDLLSLKKRLLLAKTALKIILRYPLFGVGLGNYLLAQQKFALPIPFLFNQPVHNVFLLFLSQAGIIISALLSLLILQPVIKKRAKPEILFFSFVILLTGSFDHYWLTLQQNWLLLGFIAGAVIH